MGNVQKFAFWSSAFPLKFLHTDQNSGFWDTGNIRVRQVGVERLYVYIAIIIDLFAKSGCKLT